MWLQESIFACSIPVYCISYHLYDNAAVSARFFNAVVLIYITVKWEASLKKWTAVLVFT